jgi:hypothetical protein
MSMNPGATTMPCASMVRLAGAPVRLPMAAILPCADADVPGVPGRAGAIDDPAVLDHHIVRVGGGAGHRPRQRPDRAHLRTKEWGSGVRLCYTPRARYAAGEFAGAKILSWAMNLTWLEWRRAAASTKPSS